MEIDREVFEVEQRIARRRAEIAHVAQATGRRAMQSLASPVALGIALGAGFLVGGFVNRKRREPVLVERRRSEIQRRKKTGLGSMLAAGAVALLRARYGTPVALAQMVMARLRKPPRVA